MGPEGFLEFRDPLAPASGFQSRQFREIEWLSGERGTWPGGGDPPAGPSLYEAFCAGLGLPEDATRGSRRSPTSTATTPATRCARRGTRSPSCWSTTTRAPRCWRHHHALMAAREIGTRLGTGGSPGSSTCAARSTGASSPSSGTCGSQHLTPRRSMPKTRSGEPTRALDPARTAPRAARHRPCAALPRRARARCSPRSPPGCCGRPTSRPWSSTCAARSGTTSRSSSRSGRRTTPTRR